MSETLTKAEKWRETFARLDAENIAAGRCTACGGSGVVADMATIDRTGNPHANRRCGRCKGDGTLRVRPAAVPADPSSPDAGEQ